MRELPALPPGLLLLRVTRRHWTPFPSHLGCPRNRGRLRGDLLEIGLHTGKALNFKPGDTLEVLYNPEQPRHVVLPGENLWLGLGMLGAFGIFILLAPFIVGVPGTGW
ncbi:DUF3592 domain-containing protein [Corallococcus interemptor]|uniref:DUF3592 domain-containing protein n=1 Tax=Corallococcus interemptor TaxID=2316720 RepID=A0A3A8Q2L1_9BACT|nr:DUF3592 domain-containing protein [Corallococcus interemptor]